MPAGSQHIYMILCSLLDFITHLHRGHKNRRNVLEHLCKSNSEALGETWDRKCKAEGALDSLPGCKLKHFSRKFGPLKRLLVWPIHCLHLKSVCCSRNGCEIPNRNITFLLRRYLVLRLLMNRFLYFQTQQRNCSDLLPLETIPLPFVCLFVVPQTVLLLMPKFMQTSTKTQQQNPLLRQ